MPRVNFSTPGSSPLTRGKLRVARTGQVVDGLIPAHAGKTPLAARSAACAAAHPRSRGENRGNYTSHNVVAGSSPLTRGKHYVDVVPSMKGFGSSPLTRGKLAPSLGYRAPRGLIPTHAGKTSHDFRCSSGSRAHPRSRGENETAPTAAPAIDGSSPLTRGKRPVSGSRSTCAGLIPAHAGKTYGSSIRPLAKAAHPRSRGENCE